MKNLKKVLALVVALTMVLGTVGFAAYTDVAEDAGEYTAVSTLSSLGILTGYEDGTFKPDGDITRAEFSAVVCRALGAKVSGTAATPFTDVAADHWASGYIAYVAGQKIVNGMGDGTFAPDANVTVEQAVKMLVVALGFEPMAAQRGGYPTGYMVVANTYGITEGIAAAQTANASRAIVSQLVYNALDVPMMEQTGFGTQIEYQIQDGTNDKEYKTLLTGLDVAKLEGTVIGTAIIDAPAADENSKPIDVEAGNVMYRVVEANDNEYFEAKTNYGEKTYDATFEVGEGVDADSYLGYSSIIYVRELTRSKYEIIAIMPGEDSETMEFGLEDLTLEEGEDEEKFDDDSIEYYTSTNKYDTKPLRLDDELLFYWNYTGEETIDDLKEAIKKGYHLDGSDYYYDVEIEVIENNGDNYYDVVIVKAYSYDRVDTLEVDRNRFDGSTYSFTFNFEDDTKVISIVDKNGEAMELADFAEDDVIAFISSNGKGKSYDWIEIVNLGQNAVTGTIGEQKKDAVFVDGTEYGLALAAEALDLGDEGTFYLTRTGKIFDFEKSASVAGNYGYILATALTNAGFEDAWQVKMLTKDNEIVTYTVRDGFNIYDKDGKAVLENIDQAAPEADIISALSVDLEIESGSDASSYPNKDADAFQKNVKDRIVTFKLDSKGLIREINKVNVIDEDGAAIEGEYNADAEKLFTSIETDALIFNISGKKDTSVFVTGTSSLVDDNTYEGYYVKNENGEVDCLILTKAGSLVDYTQDLAIVESVTTTTVNEENAKKVYYYTSDEEELKEIIIMEDDSISQPVDTFTTYGKVDTGAIMMFTDDGNGTAAAYAIVGLTTYAGTGDRFEANTELISDINDDADLDTKIYYNASIDDTKKVTKGTNLITSKGEFTILGTTNTYTIKDDNGGDKSRIYVGDWAALESVDTAKGHGNGKVNQCVIKVVDDKLADLVTFAKTIEAK